MQTNIENVAKIRVTDQSSTIQAADSVEKQQAFQLLSKFDVEYTSDRTKAKHYPLDDLVGSDGDFDSKVAAVSQTLWLTLTHHLQNAINSASEKVKEKIGKVYVTNSNRFNVTNNSNEVKLYLFVYESDTGTELMSEINFGVEIY
jgi:hypothetical protein